jgi:signal transduction histidine kinase/ligand-binding sensor domain-containing protein
MKYRLLFVLCLLLFQPASAHSARADVPFRSFDHISTGDGLVGGAVEAILEDQDGFMWFGTQQGLNRYDGYNFKNYDTGVEPGGLSDSNIRALLQDSAGTIWIGTASGGLNRLDAATGALSHYRPSAGNPLDAAYDSITALAGDDRDGLWLATGGGLVHFDPTTKQFSRLSTDGATALASGGGRAWVGERGQVATYTLGGGKLATYPLPGEARNVFGMLYDRSDRLWVGTDDGLWVLEDLWTRVAGLPGGTAVEPLLGNAADQVWAGTRGSGLYLLDPSGAVVQHYSQDPDDEHTIASDFVLSLYESRAGILWAGTWSEGISLLVPRKFPRHFALGLPLAFAPDMRDSAESTWVGTFNEGLSRVSSSGEVLDVYRHDAARPQSLSSDLVFALLPETDGGLWVGTLGGLDYLAPGDEQFVHFRHDPGDSASPGYDQLYDQVRVLYRDEPGTLWVGTPAGLHRFEPTKGYFKRVPIGDGAPTSFQSVLALYEDEQGRLWIGGEDGLAVLDLASGHARKYDTANSSLCHNFLTAIHPGPAGSLWLASWGGGLIHFDPSSNKTRCYDRRDGLVDNVVLALTEDKAGNLWMSTPRGLSRFDPVQEQFETFTTADGLPHNDFAQAAVLQRPDGSLWFGNTKGIIHFQPLGIPVNEYVPPVALTGFYLFNQLVGPGNAGPLHEPVEQSATIHLEPEQNSVSFEYAALNYLNPSQNQYAYRLRGFDDEWVDAGERRLATFTNLSPGTYTFQVIASNNDGIWNEEGTSVQLLIAAPWWQSWWAYLGYVLLSLLLVGGLVELRTRAHRRALAHERRLRERLELIDGMKEAERERIARELHDGLAQTLAGLRFRARVWKTLLVQQPAQLEEELDELGTILDESIQDVRRSIFALRPAGLEELGLVPALEEAAKTISRQYQVPVHTDLTPVGEAVGPGLELNLFHIASELLSNAARHAQAGEIWLVLQREPEHVRLEVRDNGQGFDAAPLHDFAAREHLGLRHLRERVTLLGGTFSLASQPGSGTHVTVTVPTVQEP